MKKNSHGFSGKPLNNESRQKLHLENEILRLKLKAQTGSDIRHQGKDLPPEIEHIFLKNIIAFEECYANAGMISLYEYIGSPAFRKPEEMSGQELETAVTELTSLMFSKNITVDFGTLEEALDKYLFITRDLFPQEVNDVRVSGIFLHFQYEEFHPDHDRDMRARTLEFISDWFERSMGKYSWELAAKCALPDGSILPKEHVLEKFRLIFESYTAFRDCQYLIRDVHFEVKENELTGIGHVEGMVKYNAVLENGEVKAVEGPYKLYMTMESNLWRIFYFVFPGFEW